MQTLDSPDVAQPHGPAPSLPSERPPLSHLLVDVWPLLLAGGDEADVLEQDRTDLHTASRGDISRLLLDAGSDWEVHQAFKKVNCILLAAATDSSCPANLAAGHMPPASPLASLLPPLPALPSTPLTTLAYACPSLVNSTST